MCNKTLLNIFFVLAWASIGSTTVFLIVGATWFNVWVHIRTNSAKFILYSSSNFVQKLENLKEVESETEMIRNWIANKLVLFLKTATSINRSAMLWRINEVMAYSEVLHYTADILIETYKLLHVLLQHCFISKTCMKMQIIHRVKPLCIQFYNFIYGLVYN